MILHIPHSSRNILDKNFLCDIELELERMTDHRTDELFKFDDATSIIFPISRLICDVERFEDDDLEIMAKKGMWVCYTTNSFGKPLRNIESDERSYIIENYYRPYHKRLTESVKLELDSHDKSLIIDCHSFSNIPLPHEDSKDIPRPDICIGVDSFHTPDNLVQFTKQYFENLNYIVKINDPFSGTIIPMDYYQKEKRVNGIMIELNRDLYKNDFKMVQLNIQNFLEKIEYLI